MNNTHTVAADAPATSPSPLVAADAPATPPPSLPTATTGAPTLPINDGPARRLRSTVVLRSIAVVGAGGRPPSPPTAAAASPSLPTATTGAIRRRKSARMSAGTYALRPTAAAAPAVSPPPPTATTGASTPPIYDGPARRLRSTAVLRSIVVVGAGGRPSSPPTTAAVSSPLPTATTGAICRRESARMSTGGRPPCPRAGAVPAAVVPPEPAPTLTFPQIQGRLVEIHDLEALPGQPAVYFEHLNPVVVDLTVDSEDDT